MLSHFCCRCNQRGKISRSLRSCPGQQRPPGCLPQLVACTGKFPVGRERKKPLIECSSQKLTVKLMGGNCQAWSMPAIPTFRKQRQEDHEFKVMLSYIESLGYRRLYLIYVGERGIISISFVPHS